jgi:hypothetical protein
MKQFWPPYVFHVFCLFAFLTFVISPLLIGMVFGTSLLESDHPAHIKMIQEGLAGRGWPAHFLFHIVVYLFAGFKSTYDSLAKASIIVLTLCFLAKAWISWEWLRRSCVVTAMATTRTLSTFLGVTTLTLIQVIALGLMFAGPIIRPGYVCCIYVGQITPNLYHNPTSLLLWPFALGVFFAGYRFLQDGRWRMLVATALLLAVGVLAKPNYAMAYAPAFGLATLYRYRISWRTAFAAIAMLPTLLILVWQLNATFEANTLTGNDWGMAFRPMVDRQIAFMPLIAWRAFSSNIPYSLFASLAFPAAYVLMFRRTLVRPGLLLFAWAILAVAVLWLIPFVETHTDGRIYIDFNFQWGAVISLFPLFLVTLGDLLSNPAASAFAEKDGRLSLVVNYRALIAWLLFVAHVASGGLWFLRQLYGVGYA